MKIQWSKWQASPRGKVAEASWAPQVNALNPITHCFFKIILKKHLDNAKNIAKLRLR